MIKKLLKISLAVITLLMAGKAQAVTADDLVKYGGDAVEIFYGSYTQRGFADRSNGVKLVKAGGDTIWVKDFYGGLCDVPFVLKNNKLYMAYTNSSYYSVVVKSKNKAFSAIRLTPCYYYNSYYGYVYYEDVLESGTITEDSNGEYLINFNTSLAITGLSGSNGNYSEKEEVYKKNFRIMIYKPNVSVTDHNESTDTDRAYNAQLTFSNDSTIKFVNWGNKGYALKNTVSPLNAAYGPVTGGINRSKSSVWCDYQFFTTNIDYVTLSSINLYGFRLVQYGGDGYYYKPLYGKINDLQAHHSGASLWVTDGGDCKTMESMKMKFRTWTAYSEKSNNNSGQPVVSNTIVNVPDHDVTLQLKMSKAAATNHMVSASWKATKNEFYVSSYDLMMVPGKYTSGADVPLDKAVAVASGIAKNAKGSYSAESSRTSEVGDDYTLFVRANYTDSLGLASTYHCLSNVTVEQSDETSLADIIGSGVSGEDYTVANDLEVVYVNGNTVYAKDAQDYAGRQVCGDLRDPYHNADFDQSNWVRITLADASAVTSGKVIEGGTLTGTFTMDANGNPELDASGHSAPTLATGVNYNGNLYNMANFAASQPSTSEAQSIFLVKPKPYEYVRVQWAIVNSDLTTFSVPAKAGMSNVAGLVGTAAIDWSMAEEGLKSKFNKTGEGYGYNFNAIVYRNRPASEASGADGGWTIAPISADGFNDVQTGIEAVTAAKSVASVRYFTMAGLECSARPSVPCVKVVTYTDGSVEAVKLAQR